MSIPVIFIHKGNSDYLFNTLYQIKYSNPATTVYLIGTKDLEIYSPLISFVDINGLLQEANEFAKVYKHYSSNPHDYELFCIQRWFILKEFFKKNNISRALYLDSDILFYSNVDEVAKKFEGYGMTISEISGHSNFLEVNVLNDFCQYVVNCYSQPDSSSLLENYYNDFKANYNSGISDMTFLANYAKIYPNKVFNYYRWKALETLDHTINNSEGWDDRFLMQGKYIKVVWQENKPYFIRKEDNSLVLTHSIHFQGNSKSLMIEYIPKKSIDFFLRKFVFKISRLFR